MFGDGGIVGGMSVCIKGFWCQFSSLKCVLPVRGVAQQVVLLLGNWEGDVFTFSTQVLKNLRNFPGDGVSGVRMQPFRGL